MNCLDITLGECGITTQDSEKIQRISVRRSYQLSANSSLMIGVGVWLVIGLIVLFETLGLLAAGVSGWAYLALIMVLLPTFFNTLELRGWIGYAGGSYRLIRATERRQLTFFSGWTYLLGWAALSALLAFSVAEAVNELTSVYITVSVPVPVLAIAILIVLTLLAILARRPRWGIAGWMMGAVILGMLAFMVVMTGNAIVSGASAGRVFTGGNRFIMAVMAVMAAMWASELSTELGGRRDRNARSTVSMWALGALLAGIFTLSVRWAIPEAPSLSYLAEHLIPGYGAMVFHGATVLVSGVTWQIVNLLMVRRLQIIGRDGWLPERLLDSGKVFNAPTLLLILMAGVGTILLLITWMVTIDDPGRAVWILASFGGVTYVVLQFGVNTAALLMHAHPRSTGRAFRIPLYPVLPLMGMGLTFLLAVFVVPFPVLLTAISWYALGVLAYLQYAREGMRTSQIGLTVFQDQARPKGITSAYPIVVAVSNPDTARDLMGFGARIAQQRDGHIILLQVVAVPEDQPLDSGRDLAQERQALLEELIDEAATTMNVQAEGVTRLARAVSQGINDTCQEEGAQLVVMGWHKREHVAGGGRLGDILDDVIEHAQCDVAVVHGDWNGKIGKVLVPAAGGPNAPRAAELALDLIDPEGEVTLLNIARKNADSSQVQDARILLNTLKARLTEPHRVRTLVHPARSPSAGIIETCETHDAMLMGASEQGFLEDQWFGPLVLQVARESDLPLALIRNYSGLGQYVVRKAWHSISDLLPTLTSQEQLVLYQDMRQSSRPNINYFVLIALSAIIATLGLILNSPAVIIGAMLVAPLMSPIVATAVGVVFGDIRTLRSALNSTLQGVLLAVFTAMLFALVVPGLTPTPEMLARTQPNLVDLMVALASGAAGAYAIGRHEVGAALPGVAIAAALMPPVCTIGIGFVLGASQVGYLGIAFGALLLLIANLAGMIFAATITFLLLGLRPPNHDRTRLLSRGLLVSITSLLVVSIPLGILLFQGVQRDRIETNALGILNRETETWGVTRLNDVSVDYQLRTVVVDGTLLILEQQAQPAPGETEGQSPVQHGTPEELNELQTVMEAELNRPVEIRLLVLRGELLDSTRSGETP